MAHVYRLHNNGAQTLDGWDNSKQYGPNEINNIIDPSGATANLPITSVPTPFAGLELARCAFGTCGSVDSRTGYNNVNGDTIYHKLVSFCLDTLEIFFSFEKLSSLFEIIPWNAQIEINNLITSADIAHQRLGQTLKLYLQQDAAAFNFNQNTIFYLLNYKEGPAALNIVGGTSTTSLTIASTNDLSYVRVPLSGNHYAYDNDTNSFRSLVERDFEFIKYVWTLTLQKGFSNTYPEVYKYVQECFRIITDQNLKNDLKNVTASYLQNYEPIHVGAANIVLPGGVIIGTYEAPDPGKISDFTILSDFADKLPLVLPNENGYNEPGMRYVSGPWNPQVRAPYFDPRDINSRTLPGDNTPYPYLTVDDIFQPYIIKTAFPVDEKNYFMGNYIAKRGFSYVLPLKKEIFKYLSLDTICGSTKGAHSHYIFELHDIAGGGVEAVINIPIQKGKYITMRRRYMLTDDEPMPQENRGVIVECNFDMYLYPSYHIYNTASIETPQRVYLMDGDYRSLSNHYEYSLELYKAQQNLSGNLITSVINRGDKHENGGMTSKIYASIEEFDIIQISNGFAEGLLIPKYSVVGNGSDSYEFAIDFGTTNTHVEYRVNNENVTRSLEMGVGDTAILSMHPNNDSIEKIFDQKSLDMLLNAPYQEFMPATFGTDDITYFPLRTNLCMAQANAKGSQVTKKITLGDYSIGFHYERRIQFAHNKTVTNLKWLGDGTQEYVASFFEELLMIIRAKVLRNGGSLQNTKITWFYPVSMEPFRLSQLKSEWEDLCYRLIDPHCAINSVTESLAPFYYYKNSEGVNAAYRPVVLMDIGGGTTDFAIYEKNRPAYISSVRFAGNSIYGDFPGFGISMNGFYNKYKDELGSKIAETNIPFLMDSFNEVINNGISADFVSFLYSLEKNAELKKRGINISFSEILKNDYSMKTSLVLFYVAEIYYLANVLKEKEIGTPAYLTVSGTGSKVLDLIGGQQELEGITKIIFNDVIGDNGKVELKRVKNPKEITCKGGLNMKSEDVVEDSDELRYCFTSSPRMENLHGHIRIKDIDEVSKQEVIDFYNNFVDYFFSLNSKFSFEKNFGINSQRSFDKYKEVLLEHAQEDLASVLDLRRSERNDPDAELEDSLFFFPLAGGLNRLSYFISKQY